ncbi:hypothetical protein RSJ42_08355 [Methanosarcina hadiensis]|uniref:hypothetical protein n=1 Tax=Methanosarcina hadiensis TaxID=3078083 RepID=UPI003977C28B
MRVYSAEDIDIISQVQAVALSTALPIILTIFKDFFQVSDQDKKKLVESENLPLKKIISQVKNDPYLVTANYNVSDEFIEATAQNLIEKKFLKRVNKDSVSLTENGRKAVQLLLVMDSNDR